MTQNAERLVTPIVSSCYRYQALWVYRDLDPDTWSNSTTFQSDIALEEAEIRERCESQIAFDCNCNPNQLDITITEVIEMVVTIVQIRRFSL